MKKILSISLIFTLLMAFAMCVSAVSVEFDEDGQLGYASAEGNVENVVVKDGTLTFDVAEGGDAQVFIRRAYNEVVSPYGVVNADMSKEIEIRFATNVKSGSFIIYFTSINPEDGSWYCRPYSSSDTSEQSYMANVRRVDFETSGNLDDFVTVKIGRSDVPYWKGIVTSLRINAAIPVGSTISIDYIRFTGDEPEPQPEPEVHEKTQMILDEEKLYGECILFDDFESYELNDVPSVVYYSNAGLNAMHGADQLASYKVVTDIGGNKTKLLELVSAGATWKYPMLNVAYVLEEKGEFTMLMDAYTEVETAISWCFHNGYSATGVDPSTGPRYRDNTNLVTCNKWQTPKSVHGTSEIAGLTSVDYFRYGAYNLDEGEKVYIDNIRAYFKPYIFATVEAGGAEGDVPEISFVKNGVITFPECNLVKEGYKFAGWKNNINNKVYQAGEKMEVGDAAEITFTATWSKFRPVLVRKSSIRTDNGAQGMRFSGYVTNENRQQADEYGFIVSTESLLKGNQLVFGENTSETDGVSPDGVKYVYGVAYDKEKGVDIVYATSGEVFGSAYWADIEGYFFTGILTDIPESGYEEKIVIRPYARVGEVYSYGDPLKRSIRDIAQNAYDNGVREEYVMNILEATKNLPNKKVCFFGDSITHDGTFIKELYQHYLNSDKEMGRVEMYNVGISGDRASQALKRVDDELMYYDPDIVVMMFGMNDINASYYIKGLTSSKLEELRKANIDEFMENITAIVDKLEGYGVEVILCTPTPYDDATDTTSEKSVGLGMCAERLRELAQERDLKVIDHFANMYPLRSQKYWGPDYIHPNKLGQHVMAQSVMYSLGYIDKMDVDTAMSSFSEENAKISTMAYNFQMMIMTERSLRAQGYADVAARKARATELRNSDQTSDMYKWIYQNYLDLIDNAIETREEIINLTEEMSYKD